MTDYKNKVAFVTGGGSGIGRALCEELARRGASVVVADLNEARATEVVAAIGKNAGQAQVSVLDVSKAEQVQRAVDECVARFGRLDLMFNNVGVGVFGEVRDMTLDLWDRIIDINLKGVVNGVMAAYPQMIRQGSGHIINMSSGFGLVSMPTHVPYSTTKFGIVGLSTGLRLEAASLGVKVSVVCPGLIQTSSFKDTIYLNVDPEEMRSKKLPFKMMSSEECSQVILRGVERNQAVITTTFFVQAMWWLYRLSPSLATRGGKYMLEDYRKSRDKFLAKTAKVLSGNTTEH
jgi:NAD(P)-dependent dehydrogenase (short-subunit alcohol dehydrogenase family)